MTPMQAFLTPQLLLYLFVFSSLFAIPAGMVLKRMGYSPAWALLCYFPLLAMAGLWVLALSPRRAGGA
jgi:hypothetical protein